jgi:hypothetical protein
MSEEINLKEGLQIKIIGNSIQFKTPEGVVYFKDFAEFNEEINVRKYIKKDIIEDIKKFKNKIKECEKNWDDGGYEGYEEFVNDTNILEANIDYLMEKFEIKEYDLK